MGVSVPHKACELARSGSCDKQESTKATRTRSGLFGFFRPQKTVSPLTQQVSQDLPAVSKPAAATGGTETADSSRDQCSPDSAWGTLPEHLIESIMQILQTEVPPPTYGGMHHSNRATCQTQFAATSVSNNWRLVGRRAFFKGLWDASGAIKHPVQLFGLSPETVHKQLVKCVMKREYDSARSKAVKYTLRLGDRMGNSTFLMTALQVSRVDMKMYLTSSCTGAPCARIETNLLGTRYEVVLDSTVQPFAQHEATHSHTPPLTFDKLPQLQSLHSMHTAQSGNGEFDVPVVDLPSTSQAAFAPATPSCPRDTSGGSASSPWSTSAADTDLPPNGPALSSAFEQESQLEFQDDTLSDLPPVGGSSPAASSSFLRRFRTPSTRNASALQSPFAAVPASSDELQSDTHLPHTATSPVASTSFLARCHSAREAFISGRAHSGANLPPMSPSSSASEAYFARSWSARAEGMSPAEGNSDRSICSCQIVPKTVGGVQYKTRIRGFMRPRRMRVTLPDPAVLACFDTAASSSCCGRSASEELTNRPPSSILMSSAGGFRQSADQSGAMESLLGSPNSSRSPWADQQSPEASTSSSLTNVAPMTPGTPTPSQTDPQSPVTPSRPSLSPSQKGVQLQNKAPHWNDTLRCWCLNFRGRVKLASVKNFQLIKADDPNKTIVMQFGKVDAYTYIMDYNPAEITAIQAFAISLSTFDTKLLI